MRALIGWKQRALSENRCTVSWISNFCFRFLTNLTQIETFPFDWDKRNGNEPENIVCMKAIVKNNVSVKTVLK